MRITALQTIQLPSRPNFLWLHVHTDEGVVGLGESQRNVDAVAAFLHGTAAEYLIGRDPFEIERHNRHLTTPYLGFNAASAEVRAAGAVDLALWDILGQTLNQPVYQLLGGLSRPSIPVYNTCAGGNYNAKLARRVVRAGQAVAEGPLDDQAAFMSAADELAHSLIEDGFAGMKIWPFDPWAEDNGGAYASAEAIRVGVEPFERVRRAVGGRIELMAELHSMWSVPAAQRIARALEPLDPLWIEDPVRSMDNVAAVADVARSTRLTVAGGETLASRPLFRDLLNASALGMVIVDIGWCGGLSEARKVASLADAWARPIAPHDCSGPVVFAASVHLSLHAPNAVFQEAVRAFLRGWYREVVTELPVIADGHVHPLTGPGLGLRLLPDVLTQPGVIRRTTDRTDV